MNNEIKFRDGRQLLIEYDSGHISPEENKQIISEMKNMDFSQDMILYAVLQKYNTPNKNGRIYPESILKRENEKYQNIIKKGGALNELNHPTCHTGDVDVLTSNGWKNIKELDDNEKIFTLNGIGELELKEIYSKVIHDYKGDMIHIKGRNIDVVVTPNHKFPIINQNKKNTQVEFITAQEIYDRFKENNSLSNFYIPKNSLIKTNHTPEFFTLKGCDETDFDIRAGENIKNTYKQDVKIPMDVFMSFMGIFLSEGHTTSSSIRKRKCILSNGEEAYYESSDNGYGVGISQKKKENVFLIEELLSLLPFKVKKYTNKNELVTFMINDRRLWKYLHPIGKAKTKFIPTELKKLHPEYLKYLINWFKMGDGRTIGKHNQSDVFSISDKLINDLQEILIKSGKSGNIRKEDRKKDRYISENGIKRLIKRENSNDMWFLTFSKTKGIYLDNRTLTVEKEYFNDHVYSVDVPNHIYYVKSNGKCHWSGNSSLIDLDRVSHSIVETWWEGNILMGKIKLFTSPGWKKMGIVSTKGDQAAMLLMNGATLGISSRGVGSLKNVRGENVVQDDFELVCFDLVSSPSTPGAYVFSDPSEREQYQESEEPEKPESFDKMKSLMGKLDNFLGK